MHSNTCRNLTNARRHRRVLNTALRTDGKAGDATRGAERARWLARHGTAGSAAGSGAGCT